MPSDAPHDDLVARTPRLEIRLLGAGDEARLQAVFREAGDHFLPVTGRPAPDPDAAEREIRGCAASPGRDVAALVWRDTGRDVGAVGWWLGHPEPDVTLLGMLMVAMQHRQRGVAREALAGLEGWLAGEGITRVRSAASADDRRAQAVLKALGFREMNEQRHVGLDRGRLRLSMLEKRIAGSSDR
jgi:RimJ/RimL family protein N-acetyltransferase